MNYTALIAEDEPLLAQALATELMRLWPGLNILARVGDGASAVAQALALRPAVCFLDIRMPGLTGLEAAQALAEDWPLDEAPFPLLVFVTAYDQYALQAFDAQAVDYLVKPVATDRLATCVARLQQRLQEREERSAQALPTATAYGGSAALDPGVDPALMDQLRALLGAATAPQPRLEVIQASLGSSIHLLPVEQVLYFEAADKYVRVVTADREYLIRTALRELLPQLDPQRFWQIHRGTVVQARAIASALRDESGRLGLTLHQRPEKLQVSRLYAAQFKAM